MKKIIFSTLAIVFALVINSHAQAIRWGLQGSFCFASQQIDDPAVTSTNSVTTYGLHLTAEKQLRNHLFLRTGVGLIGKGVVIFQSTQTSTITLSYIDLPINLVYKADMNTLGKFYIGAGPYFSYGMNGNIQYQDLNTSSGEALAFGQNEDYVHIDGGISFISGLELNNHLSFNLGYQLGLNNLATESQNLGGTNTIKNRLFSIGLGLNF